jgi:hypothetical protein
MIEDQPTVNLTPKPTDEQITEDELQTALADVPPELFNQFRELLERYAGLWRNRTRGVVESVQHEIVLTHERPVVTRPRPRTAEQVKAINEEIDKMLKDEVIRPSCSPYVSEIVMVLKKTGDWTSVH